ncbi:MAG: UDP-N-acetylmuramoyl-L-alanine--D-glutamate ligase [Candidatus Eisenbacteria bacterium]|nr:UDP-N-acetylmuramoyl-L-alanine--D-glutamate ligase [Candidatus Eisenbacteria bacterium]
MKRLFDGLALRPKQDRPRVAVLGLARSGRAVARLLSEGTTELDLELLDLNSPRDAHDPEADERIAREMDELVARGAQLRIGPHDAAWLDRYDLLIKSPGIPPRVPFVAAALERGVPVVGEIEVAALWAEGAAFAITGTNGKSTTTAWAGDMLRRAGLRAEVCGNIGRPLAEAVLENRRGPFVIELSSFQIQDSPRFTPAVAALLNFTPDHLDYHRDLAEYREAKLSLFRRLPAGALAVLGPDDTLAAEAAADAQPGRPGPRVARFRLEDRGEPGAFVRGEGLWLRDASGELRLLDVREVSLPGPHNLENALAAACGARELGAPVAAIVESLRRFGGLPHRLELVGEVLGVRFVNDSKATNVDSLAVALRSFDRPVVLIAGGRDKGQDFVPLAPLVRQRVATLVLIGEGAERIGAAWSGVPALRADDFSAAVRQAFQAATPGQTVLLSPACASFDLFRNYEHRGDCFREEVRRLAAECGPAASPTAGSRMGTDTRDSSGIGKA